MIIGISVYAQGRPGYSMRDNDRDRGRYERNHDRYDDNRHHDSRYYNANYNQRYLPVRVRQRLRHFERRLAECKHRALRDGYVSRSEARRIRSIERDINELLFEYRGGRYYSNGYNNRVCR